MTTYVRRRSKPVARVARRFDVYTDGACSGSPGPGGWAWAVLTLGIQDSGSVPETTNQRMEMLAVVKALEDPILAGFAVTICTDSAYVMNCFVERWYCNWTKGKKRNGDTVANWDLWQRLIPLVLEGDVQWRKVKGHSGDLGNDLVDRLAVEAKKRIM